MSCTSERTRVGLTLWRFISVLFSADKTNKGQCNIYCLQYTECDFEGLFVSLLELTLDTADKTDVCFFILFVCLSLPHF